MKRIAVTIVLTLFCMGGCPPTCTTNDGHRHYTKKTEPNPEPPATVPVPGAVALAGLGAFLAIRSWRRFK